MPHFVCGDESLKMPCRSDYKNLESCEFYRKKKPPANEWSTVEISQAERGSKVVFSLVVNGERLWTVENTDPKEFSDVQVFASNPWHVAQAGSIRGFRIENMMPGESKLSYVELYMILFSFDSTME